MSDTNFEGKVDRRKFAAGVQRSRFRPRVLLVDDHPMFLRGLRLTLDNDFEIVGAAVDGNEALALADQTLPDVVLLDINLPGGKNGFEVCRQLKLRLPQTAVIILSVYEDDEQLFQAIRAGAAAYSPKDISVDKLLDLVQQVVHGSYPINDSVLMKAGLAKRVLNQFRNLDGSNGTANSSPEREIYTTLTPREVGILECIAQGQSNKEIAMTLSISDQTVKNHITNILRKLNANDRTQAVMMALRQGWIKLPMQDNA